MDTGTLFLFAKFPQPGSVKTRLIPLLGADGAASLAEAFLIDLLQRLSGADLGPGVRRVLCFDPPDEVARFHELLSEHKLQRRFSLLPQVAGNLGKRLGAALKHAEGGTAVFIGSDAPDLPIEEIKRGLRCAKNGRAYLKHATDGGYVLLALPAGTHSAVFQRIDWSSHQTAEHQATRLRDTRVPLSESANMWPDIDQPADLPHLKTRLQSKPHIAPRTLSLLRTLI